MLGCGSTMVRGVSWTNNRRILAFKRSRSLSFCRTLPIAPSPLMMKSKHLSIDRRTFASSFWCICLWRFNSRRGLIVSLKKAEEKASKRSSRVSRIFLSQSITRAPVARLACRRGFTNTFLTFGGGRVSPSVHDDHGSATTSIFYKPG